MLFREAVSFSEAVFEVLLKSKINTLVTKV